MIDKHRFNIFCKDKRSMIRIKKYLLKEHKDNASDIRMFSKDFKINLLLKDNGITVLEDLKYKFPSGYVFGYGSVGCMNKFQLNERVVISSDCPNHGGKKGIFQFQSTVGKIDVAIIQDSNTKRQFKVNLEYVQKETKV